MSFLREPNAEPIPGYRIISPLGSGGFGEVWKCQAPGGIYKAIKFVFGNLNSLDVDGVRAEQELKALNRVKSIRHPFILQMDRIEIVNGELVIVMELADKSLHDSLEESQAAGLMGIPRDSLLRYLRDAAEALDHMHEVHSLQHLDIKPRNLFLVSDRVKVADFGLVKNLAAASGIMGGVTPLYAPPETFTGEVSATSDQYSLAIVYQELLTGHRPFNGKNARQLAQQHMNEAPDLRALPEAERSVVARALDKNPLKRFPNCLAFVRMLYSSRSASLANILIGQDSASGGRGPLASGNRPKTIIDTMENVQLEGHLDVSPVEGLEPVDLGIPVEQLEAELGNCNEAISNLGLTLAQPMTGTLRPTLILGLGGFGRRALLELRCRLLDRFGDLEKVPLFRFLLIDTDPEGLKQATKGAEEVAFSPAETHPLPLQQASRYRGRAMDQLGEWLPREKLFDMPRSLKTQGSRGLGRLAFSDNFQRLMAKIKRELQAATNPDTMYATAQQTGLAMRDNSVRVWIIGSATGGASGYINDLAYATRRMIAQNGSHTASVCTFLSCGAPEDPATPKAELANLYATLTEIRHFGDPSIRFSAQYGVDGPRLVDEGAGIDSVYLLPQSHRTPDSRRDVLSHLGSFLYHELTTPLGLRLDYARRKKNAENSVDFRSLGTFGVWFPRGLLLRLAAREACCRLLEDWQTTTAMLTSPEQASVDAAIARTLAEPEWKLDKLAARLDALAGEHLDGPPQEVLTRMLMNVEGQSIQNLAQEDPGNWAKQTLARMRDWLGSGVPLPGVNPLAQRRSALTRAMETAAMNLANEWSSKLIDIVKRLMEHTGRRVAVAEAALSRLIGFCEEQLNTKPPKGPASRLGSANDQLELALANCHSGTAGWSLFGGGKSKRLLRVFVDHLAAYSRHCLTEDSAATMLLFWSNLKGKLSDRMRDLSYCRSRLRQMRDLLMTSLPEDTNDADESENVADTQTFTRTPGTQLSGQTPLITTEGYWKTIRESRTNRVVLPDGEVDLEQAAKRFVSYLTNDHWAVLDQVAGERVLQPRGGLLPLCMDNSSVVRYFLGPLLTQIGATLGEYLPLTDVAQAEFSSGGKLTDRIDTYHHRAVPLMSRSDASKTPGTRAGTGSGVRMVVGQTREMPQVSTEDYAERGPTRKVALPGDQKAALPVDQMAYLLVPVSEAGRVFSQEARKLFPDLNLVNVPGQSDLMFCREQGGLRLEDLERLLQLCRSAYQESSSLPRISPHSRFDILDWSPLDP
jgi:hypothetical protein